MTIRTRTIGFQILWLLVIGGILTMIICYGIGIILLKQSNEQLSKLKAEIYSLQMVELSLLRELAPIIVGLLLAFLAPLINILSYLRIKKIELEDMEKSKILFF